MAKHKHHGFFKFLGKEIKKAGHAAGKIAKGVASVAEFVPLKIVEPVLKKALIKKGVTPPKKLKEVAEAFVKYVVKNQPVPASGHFQSDEHIIDDIVGIILDFIRGISKKKKDGHPLTPIEQTVLDEADKTGATIEDAAIEHGNIVKHGGGHGGGKIGGLLNPKVLMIVAAIIIVVVILEERK